MELIITCRLEDGDFTTVCDTEHERQIRFNFDRTLAPLILVSVLACTVIPVLRCSAMRFLECRMLRLHETKF